jgi:hypothetical protein
VCLEEGRKEGKYVSHAPRAAVFLQYANDELFLTGGIAKRYFEIVSEPKKLKIYQALMPCHCAPLVQH